MKTLISFILLLALASVVISQSAHSAAASNSPPSAVTLHDFKLVGNLSGGAAVFTLTANARVESSRGGSLDLLSGAVALTDISLPPKSRLRVEQNRFVLSFDRRGIFPIRIRFNAGVRASGGWKVVDFRVAPGALQSIVLQGLARETQFQFERAARPERQGDEFASFLPSDGAVNLLWKEAGREGGEDCSTPSRWFHKSASVPA
jgi:hypothetical protein